MASSLATGSTPGRPRQTGQTFVFGGAPNSLAQPHHILDFVLSWTCVSNPMTGSYSIRSRIVAKGQRRCTLIFRDGAGRPPLSDEASGSQDRGRLISVGETIAPFR